MCFNEIKPKFCSYFFIGRWMSKSAIQKKIKLFMKCVASSQIKKNKIEATPILKLAMVKRL